MVLLLSDTIICLPPPREGACFCRFKTKGKSAHGGHKPSDGYSFFLFGMVSHAR